MVQTATRDSDAAVSASPESTDPLVIPSDYVESYERARRVDPVRARNYMVHTMVGDPTCDEMMEQLDSIPLQDADRFIRLAIEDPDDPSLKDAPDSVHKFIEELETIPAWADFDEFALGVRAFHRDSHLCLVSMLAGVLLEGFSTTIAKSFFITGRLRDQGVRRMRQNNRHMIEIFMPGGLETRGDGWRLAVRSRLIHAKVRHLFNKSPDEWDASESGVALSSAHTGFASAAFSSRMLQFMKRLGSTYDDDERDGFMAVWRYSNHLMGVPESILYHDYFDAVEIVKVGWLCEPDPGIESIVLANSLVNSAPLVAGITDPDTRRSLSRYIFKMSRALIGDEKADALMYPSNSTFAVLPWFRFQRRYHNILKTRFPKLSSESSFSLFNTLLEASALQELNITYKMPNHVYAEESRAY